MSGEDIIRFSQWCVNRFIQSETWTGVTTDDLLSVAVEAIVPRVQMFKKNDSSHISTRFLFFAARRAMRDFARKYHTHHVDIHELADVFPDKHKKINRDDMEVLYKLLDTLSDLERRIIEVHYLGDSSLYKLSSELGMSYQMAYIIKDQALAKLKFRAKKYK